MNHRRLLLAVPLLAALLAACGPPRPSRVVIGIGMTSNTHRGVKLAAQEINAQGGIDGMRLDLAGLDWRNVDSYNARSILEWAERFNAIPELVAVIGHNDSAATLSGAASYNRDGIPQIVTIATNPAITNIGSWTYRLCLSDAAQGPALATYAVKDWQKKRIAIIYVNDDYGRGLAHLFEARVRALGAKVVATVMHHNLLDEEDRESIREGLADMKARRPDLVALFQRVNAARWTLKALRDSGLKVDILGGDDLAQNAFARGASPGAGVAVAPGDSSLAEGVRVSQFLNLDTTRPEVARFAQGIRAAAGRDPDYAQAFAYDAVYLIRDAVLHGGPSRAGVKGYLDAAIAQRRRLEGVTGSYILAPDHDARRPLYVAEIRGGALHLLAALPVK